jgi:hypothetical protein
MFRSGRVAVRAFGYVVLLGVDVVAAWALSRVTSFPAGYGPAQSGSAEELAGLRANRIAELLEGARRDLGRYLPGYVAIGTATVAFAYWQRGRCREDRRFAGFAVGAVAVAGAADLVETLLFRETLQRLQAGLGREDIEALADVTRGFTVAKWSLLATSGALLGALVLRRPRP